MALGLRPRPMSLVGTTRTLRNVRFPASRKRVRVSPADAGVAVMPETAEIPSRTACGPMRRRPPPMPRWLTKTNSPVNVVTLPGHCAMSAFPPLASVERES